MTTFLLSAVVGSRVQSGVAPGEETLNTGWVRSVAHTHSMGGVCSIHPQHG